MPILSLSNDNGAFPGNVGLLATDGALRQAGVRTHRIVGDADDEATLAAAADWLRAAQAVATIRNEVYGLYGGHSMGMETGFFHLVPTIKALGTNAYHIDQLWVLERMKSVDAAEARAGRQWLEQLLGDRLHYDDEMLTPEKLELQLRLYLALRELNDENGFDYCGIKGQRELSEHVCIPDVAEMLLNDPYDWRGPKEPTVCATEADAYGAVTMQLLKYVSGGLPSLFMDVRLYHRDLDVWDFVNSGQHATWYATRSDDPAANFAAVTFHPALRFYFKAGGASVEFDAAPGPGRSRGSGLWDDRLYFLIVPGEIVDLPHEQRPRSTSRRTRRGRTFTQGSTASTRSSSRCFRATTSWPRRATRSGPSSSSRRSRASLPSSSGRAAGGCRSGTASCFDRRSAARRRRRHREHEGRPGDTRGGVVAEHEVPLELLVPQPGWAEHDAEASWWGDFVAICRTLLAGGRGDAVGAVGVSGIGPCFCAADASGRALLPAILYGVDTRATAEIEELDAQLGRERHPPADGIGSHLPGGRAEAPLVSPERARPLRPRPVPPPGELVPAPAADRGIRCRPAHGKRLQPALRRPSG